jgi:restriction endonuclease S subunit
VRPDHQATCYFEKAYNIVCSTGFTVITPDDRDYCKWIFYCTPTKQFVYNPSNLMVGASFPAVNDGDILVRYIDLPDKRILHKWEGILNYLYNSYNTINSKHKMFSELRTQIISQFFQPGNNSSIIENNIKEPN